MRAPLKPNDLVLVYTDGVTEARMDDGTMLGDSGVLELVKQLDPTHAPQFLQQLRSSLTPLACIYFEMPIRVLIWMPCESVDKTGSIPNLKSLDTRRNIIGAVTRLRKRLLWPPWDICTIRPGEVSKFGYRTPFNLHDLAKKSKYLCSTSD